MNNLHLILECLYFVSGAVIAAFAGIGLKQLSITKEASRLSAKRESFRLAAERCDYYLTHVIPLINLLHLAIKEHDIKFFEKTTVVVKGESVKVESQASRAEIEKVLLITKQSAAAFNAMESFATFFTSGVADETVGFDSVGHTFCHTTREFLPDLIVYTKDGEYYQSIIKLFFIWNSRIESQRIVKKREALTKRLEEINNQTIYPVGTK